MKKALITGGAGFIGSNLARYLIEKDFQVTILDNFSSGREENIKEIKDKINLLKLDVRNLESIKKSVEEVDYIFHLAALVSVPESVKREKETFEINTGGTKNIVELARRRNVKKIVFPSSAAVYGDLPGLPKSENSELAPKSPYAKSKIKSEEVLKDASEKYGIDTASLRFFNVYGPRQDPNSDYAAVIPIFIKRALQNKDLIIYGDGNQTRDFIYVKDVCRAFIKTLSKNTNGEIFNIASGSETSINKLANKIIQFTDSDSEIKYEEKRPGEVFRSVADISKAKKELNYTPKYSLNKGIKNTIKWVKNR